MAPAELITMAGPQAHFEPRIWSAGRRFMSMSAATLRMPSTPAPAMSSRRVRGLRSFQCCAAVAMTASRSCGNPRVVSTLLASRPRSPCGYPPDGLITRAVFAEVPPRVEYDLTTLGHSLLGLVSGLEAWTQ